MAKHREMATAAGILFLFFTAAAQAAPLSGDVVIHPGKATVRVGDWAPAADASAADSIKMYNLDRNVAKRTSPSAAPANYFETSFYAEAGKPYRLWMRLKGDGANPLSTADDGDYADDSVYVQFSGSLNSSGAADFRIGSASALYVIAQACDTTPRTGWQWADADGWCGDGPTLSFATTGMQTVRIQPREDGTSIDQIVLSPNVGSYLSASPGALYSDNTMLAEQGLTAPAPPPSNDLRVLQWNVEDGTQAGEITTVVSKKPDIAFVEEVDTSAQVEKMRAGLQTDQGVTFYRADIGRDNTRTAASWVGILSKYPLSNVQTKKLRSDGQVVSCGGSTFKAAARTVIGVLISVGGKQLAVIGVRTNYANLKCVTQEEIRTLKTWAEATYPGVTRVYGGDFNTSPGETPYTSMVTEAQTSTDTWEVAVLDKTATAESTPSFNSPTKGGRLDYVFYQTGPTTLSVKSGQIYPLTPYSDHRPIMTVFTVK